MFNPVKPNAFPKEEKLYGKLCIESLLAGGSWGKSGDLKYCWIKANDGSSTSRVMVSVSKKFFKRAVKRNLLKRRIREAYRLQKSILEGIPVNAMFSYNTSNILSFNEIYTMVGDILRSIAQKANA